MVRKQLYLRSDQDRRLKSKAREMGLSEAELVRMAVDRFLGGGGGPMPGHLEALTAFLDEAAKMSREHRFPERWRFRREELYDRTSRWERQ